VADSGVVHDQGQIEEAASSDQCSTGHCLAPHPAKGHPRTNRPSGSVPSGAPTVVENARRRFEHGAAASSRLRSTMCAACVSNFGRIEQRREAFADLLAIEAGKFIGPHRGSQQGGLDQPLEINRQVEAPRAQALTSAKEAPTERSTGMISSTYGLPASKGIQRGAMSQVRWLCGKLCLRLATAGA